jgi:beta-galactosidase
MEQDGISRRQLLGAAVVAAGLRRAGAEEARGAARSRESFDFGWMFARGDGAERSVDLPHDWSIEGPFDENAPASGPGAYLPTGIGWYRKHFRVPAGFEEKKLTIEFDGVYQNSEVWINGAYLGRRPYGYVPLAYDITPHVRFGGDNLVVVKVDNSRQTNCRWYSGSGIYRHTWLLATNRIHIGYWGTFVTTPRVAGDKATVQVETTVRNEAGGAARCTLTTAILDRGGREAGRAEASQQVAAGGNYRFVQQMVVESPKLWSDREPYLYRVHSTLRDAGGVVDEYDTPVGIREAVFDADRGFLLNGEAVKLNGVCLHQDAGCVGSAVPERMWERRLALLKEMGANAIRTSHNPYSAEFLDLCDRMGFLVMNEAFDEWRVPKGQIGPYGYSIYFDEWHERDLLNFIHRDRNHPSVVLWSAGNEIPDQQAPGGAETLRELLDIFHREDPTRVVTAACDHIESEPAGETARPEFLALLDVVGYNYVDRWRDRREKYYSIDRHRFPQRRVIGTESPSMAGIRGDYSGSEATRGFPGMPGHNLDVEQLWKFVRTYDYVAGDFMWTGIDYLGEEEWPMKGASAGVIDTCGFKKDGFYFYQSQWTGGPVLHLFPHWNWKGSPGRIVPVTCYTNCDTVELFLNGRSLGVKGYYFPRVGMEGRYNNYPARARVERTTSDLHLTWDVPYEAGTLRAVGTRDGKVAATLEVSTTGEPAAIALSVDRQTLAADRRDVAHVTVEIVDAQGRVVPTADNEVTFAIEGEARVIGVDNGNPASHESYQGNRRKAFNGMCLAMVGAAGKAGAIRVTASAEGLRPAMVEITGRAG